MILRLLFIFSILSCSAISAQAQSDSTKTSTIDSVAVLNDTIPASDKVISDSTMVKKTTPTDTLALNQTAISDSTVTDSLAVKPKVNIKTAFQIFIDYGKFLTIPTDFETKYEAGVAFQMKNKLVLVAHAGQAELHPGSAIENGEYTVKGQYFKGGINYLIPLDNTNKFYIGGRYAMSTYDESGRYEISSPLWPNITRSFERKDLSATWAEVVFGTEKKLKNPHWLIGGTFALRILIDHDTVEDDSEPVETFAIPGYGRAFDSTEPAINVYIKWQL